MKRITQCKTEREIVDYFLEGKEKFRIKYGFSLGEAKLIDAYCTEVFNFAEICGERLRKIRKSYGGKSFGTK